VGGPASCRRAVNGEEGWFPPDNDDGWFPPGANHILNQKDFSVNPLRSCSAKKLYS